MKQLRRNNILDEERKMINPLIVSLLIFYSLVNGLISAEVSLTENCKKWGNFLNHITTYYLHNSYVLCLKIRFSFRSLQLYLKS